MDDNGKILVEVDYDNIILIDPNKTVAPDGRTQERTVRQEDMVMYANLEATLISRSRENAGEVNGDLVTIATSTFNKMNFMSPGGKDGLTTQWADEITGTGSLNGEGINQIREEVSTTSEFSISRVVENPNDSETLGIETIIVDNNAAQTPKITIELIDVQGRTLFEKGDRSPYAAFFNLPYPTFFLTLKGYYGKAVRYQLMLTEFTSELDSGSGNFRVRLTFYSYRYMVLADLQVGSINALPNMYTSDYLLSYPDDPSANINREVVSVNVSRGYEKIREVYGEYKTRGLIPWDFPEFSLPQLVVKLEYYENSILGELGTEDLYYFSDARNMIDAINELKRLVFSNSIDSWGRRFLNMNDHYILASEGEETTVRVFGHNKETITSRERKEIARAEINSHIEDFKHKWTTNKTFGPDGSYKRGGEVISSGIEVDIDFETILANVTDGDIDWEKTFKKESSSPVSGVNFKEEVKKKYGQDLSNIDQEELFVFDGPGSFNERIKNMLMKVSAEEKEMEDAIKAEMQRKFESTDFLGFKPTIRNILAIVFASVEGMLRLMEDVHDSAFKERYNRIRRESVLGNGNDEIGVEGKGRISGENEVVQIYPWPEFMVKKEDEKSTRFDLRYPGERSLIPITKGDDHRIWPEVEFVEEMAKAMTINDTTFNLSDYSLNGGGLTRRTSPIAAEYPLGNNPYGGSSLVGYFFELKERLRMLSTINRFNRTLVGDITTPLSEFEVTNIITSLSAHNSELINMLKTLNVDEDFDTLLKQVSNEGNGKNWQTHIRGLNNTDYIRKILDEGDDFAILKNKPPSLGRVKESTSRSLDDSIRNRSKVLDFMDVYPMTDINWIRNNVADGEGIQSVNNFMDTSRTIGFNDSLNTVTNFASNDGRDMNRPFTSFSFREVEIPPEMETSMELSSFYEERTSDKNFFPTEGMVGDEHTFSILNSPFFINSLRAAVDKTKAGDQHPFIECAYLFLNSLPLSTIRERYRSLVDGAEVKGDYILPSLKMFAATHRLPYAWILKYGSIWNRYKNFIDSGSDFLPAVWTTTDSSNNFDPQTGNDATNYSVTVSGSSYAIIKENIGFNVTAFNLGFYPKLINDIHYLYTGKDMFSGYTSTEIQDKVDTGTLNIDLTDNITYQGGMDPNNPNRVISMRFWSTLIRTNDTTSFDDGDAVKLLITPSFGTTTNETKAQCFDHDIMVEEVLGNDAVIDGSCRLLWGAPNYGYFRGNGASMPTPEQYLKEIDTSSDQQEPFSVGSQYASIEDLMATFKPEILNLFEDEFLKFSRSLWDTTEGGYKNNFHALLRELLSVEPSSSGETVRGVMEEQFRKARSIMDSFISNNDVHFVHGNPANYNKRAFSSLLPDAIVDPYQYGHYEAGSLPPDSTLSDSLNNNVQAWKAMMLYVGNFSDGPMKYSDMNNPFTSFFIENNVQFTEENVKFFYPLIRIYATKKLQGSYNKTMFETDIENYSSNSLAEMEDRLLSNVMVKLQGQLPDVDNVTERYNSPTEDDQGKLELWQHFKTFNDRWIAGNRYKNKILFEDLLLLDRASRDIGDLVHVDVFKLKELLKGVGTGKGRVIDLISRILEQNKFILMPLPSFVNFYGVTSGGDGSAQGGFADDLFGTFMEVDYMNSTPKLVCVYTDVPSQHLDLRNNENYLFRTDAYDIRNITANTNRESLLKKTDWKRSNKCVAFNVDFGTRNQSMFKSMSLSQENTSNTSETFKVHEMMAEGAGGRSVGQQNVSLWNEYRSRSYTCTVIGLGNALIQPTMYFNLRHVPMFSGPYLIISTKHTINGGEFITQFTGVRIPIYTLPSINNSLSALNVNLFKNVINNLKKKYERTSVNPYFTENRINKKKEIYVSGSKGRTFISESCLMDDNGAYSTFTPAATARLSRFSMKDVLRSIEKEIPTTDERSLKERAMVFSVAYIDGLDGTDITAWNNNLGGAKFKTLTNEPIYHGEQRGNFNAEYLCLRDSNGNTLPYLTFNSLDESISFIRTTMRGRTSSIDMSNFTTDSTESNTLSNTLLKAWLTTWLKMDDVDFTELLNTDEEMMNTLRRRFTQCVSRMNSLGLLNP